MLKFSPLILLMIACTVAGNILLKIGASRGAGSGEAVQAMLTWRVLSILANGYLGLGILLFGTALGVYVICLRHLPLNLMQSLATAQFVGTILASAVVLSEPISLTRWLGIAMITAGILVVAWSTH